MDITQYLVQLVQSGMGSLTSYLAAHVLLCLLPAFFIAGGISALVPKEAITRFLGRNAPKCVAYPISALAGSTLAVCSCTIVPLFAGIYMKGAGLGPAVTFLFFAPAGNILALAYTGAVLGAEFTIARLILSLVFGIGIGMIMSFIFYKSDQEHCDEADASFVGEQGLRFSTLIFLLIMVALLLFGTLKISLLTDAYARFTIPMPNSEHFQALLNHLVPFDAAKGEEGLTIQGVLLIGLLALIGATSFQGLGKVDEGYNRWTWISLSLAAFTLIIAAMRMEAAPGGLNVEIPGKLFGIILTVGVLFFIARRFFDTYEVQQWLWETWRFVKMIFPLLVVGVFAVGVIRQFIRPEWIQAIAGQNTILANLAAVVFGVFMYFPTLVEVPIAKMFLSLGMHKGPLIAYLMSDPELSLQSILITASIIGRARALTYVFWVALFSAASGLIYGAWVDGASGWLLGGYLVLFIVLLIVMLSLIDRHLKRIPSTV